MPGMLNLLCEMLIEVSEGVSHCHSTLQSKTFIYWVMVLYPFPVKGALTGWRIGSLMYPFSVMAMLLGQAFVLRANYIAGFFVCLFSCFVFWGGMVGQCSCSLRMSHVQSACCGFVYDEHTPDNSIHWLLLNCYSKDILQWNRRE